MVIVASLALSLMLTNNLFIPIGLYFSITKHLKDDQQWGKWVLYTRRASILLVLSLAYLYLYFIINVPLVSIGLTSFVAVCQFVPAIVGGLYWKEATRKGALAGILVGFGLWLFTLIVPTLVGRGLFSANIMSEGLWGIAWLKPYQLFGMTDLEPVSHSLFWSLLGNSFTYIGVSAFTSQTSQERNQAELFVDVFKYSNVYDEVVVWRGIAHKKDLEDLLSRFLDKEKVQSLLADFEKEQVASVSNQEHNARLVKYAERILASTIGSTSARILVRSVVQEEEIGKEELLQMLRESQEIKKNNFELKKADKQKNEFISTITHELRTPITSIRSLSEILYENPDLEEAQKQQFLQTVIGETERMERLINQVLDLEKFESGKQTLHLEVHTINDILKEAITIYQSVVTEKKLELKTKLLEQPVWVMVDKDRLLQVILNLLSNAVKFARHTIWIESSLLEKQLEVSVSDDGKGVPEELREAIFEKFFQAENQNIRKPKGSGLGLAICKKIIQYHQGYIGVECKEGVTRFYFRLNVYPKS
jgi:signal transduction histidine kinase